MSWGGVGSHGGAHEFRGEGAEHGKGRLKAPESVEPLRRNGCAPTGWRGSSPGRLAGGPTASRGARVWVGGWVGSPAAAGPPGCPIWAELPATTPPWPASPSRPTPSRVQVATSEPCHRPPGRKAGSGLGCVWGEHGVGRFLPRGALTRLPVSHTPESVQLEKETSIQGRRGVGDCVYCGPGWSRDSTPSPVSEASVLVTVPTSRRGSRGPLNAHLLALAATLPAKGPRWCRWLWEGGCR